jgi:hypothetical protein
MTIDDDILKQLLRINDEGLEGVSFDAVSEEPGRSIRDIDDRSIRDLVEHINPFLKGWREHCQENLPRDTEDEFGFLTADLADTGFALGVLFGAMVQGASEQEIDRLDRGFIHSNARRWWYREGTMCRWRPPCLLK